MEEGVWQPEHSRRPQSMSLPSQGAHQANVLFQIPNVVRQPGVEDNSAEIRRSLQQVLPTQNPELFKDLVIALLECNYLP